MSDSPGIHRLLEQPRRVAPRVVACVPGACMSRIETPDQQGCNPIGRLSTAMSGSTGCSFRPSAHGVRKLQSVILDSRAVPAGRVGRSCLIVVLVSCLFISGCSQPTLKTAYGTRRGDGGASVDGTGVLAGLFESEGFKAYTWRRLSPKLNSYQVIVWTPDDFSPPDEQQRRFLDQWLTSDQPRTLVYVGRDFDAISDYWRRLLVKVPAGQKVNVLDRLALSRSEHAARRLEMPEDECVEWFTVRRDSPRCRITHLEGPWARGIDASRANIWVQGLLEVPKSKDLIEFWSDFPLGSLGEPGYEVLLSSHSTALVTEVVRPEWGGNKLLVVANGSFLLNLPLINHSNRRLAGQLIDVCGGPGKVAFLESKRGGPPVYYSEPQPESREDQSRRVVLAFHWFVLGMCFCFCILPIFGRPRSGKQEAVADFSQHIDALGALLQKAGDQSYARRQIGHYRNIASRESGGRHDSKRPEH